MTFQAKITRYTICAAMALSMFGSIPSTVNAAPVTIEFGGVLGFVSNGLGNLFNAGIGTGTNFTGQFSYDTSTASTSGSSTFGAYPTIEFNIAFAGGATITSTGNPVITVENNVGGIDRFIANIRPSQPTYNGILPYDSVQISLHLSDTTESVFSNNSLPDTLVLSDFNSVFLSYEGLMVGSSVRDSFIVGLTSLNEVAVPVPAALPLFFSGLLGLGIVARYRKKQISA